MAFYAKVVQTSNVTMQTPFKRYNAHVSKYWTVIFSDLILRRRKTNFHRLNGHIFWTEQAVGLIIKTLDIGTHCMA
jgi:hypothetical protein